MTKHSHTCNPVCLLEGVGENARVAAHKRELAPAAEHEHDAPTQKAHLAPAPRDGEHALADTQLMPLPLTCLKAVALGEIDAAACGPE